MTPNDSKDKKGKGHQRILNWAAIMMIIAGLVAVLNGIWFIVGDHPFYLEKGYAKDFDMTESEVQQFNPQLAKWVMHVSDQVGSVSVGWGLFIITLAWVGIRHGRKWAWNTLWVGGTPTALYASFGELLMFGAMDFGSILSLVVLTIFLVAMLLPIRILTR